MEGYLRKQRLRNGNQAQRMKGSVMQFWNELKKKLQVVWIAAKPILKEWGENKEFVHFCGLFILGLLVVGAGSLWENVEEVRWFVGLGVGGVVLVFVLLLVAELAPLLIALAALVYLFKNC